MIRSAVRFRHEAFIFGVLVVSFCICIMQGERVMLWHLGQVGLVSEQTAQHWSVFTSQSLRVLGVNNYFLMTVCCADLKMPLGRGPATQRVRRDGTCPGSW